MSLGQRLNLLEATLDHLRVAIDQEKLKLAAKGSTPQVTDMLYHDFWRRVQGFRPRLAAIESQLKSMGHALDLRRQGLWNVPRERRFSARQSVSDHRSHLARVQRKAWDVLGELQALDRRGGTPTDADLIKNVTNLLKKGEDFVKGLNSEAVAQHLKDASPAPGPPQGGSLTAVGVIVSMIVIYLHRGPRRD